MILNKSKRGFLLGEETVKLILAVISITFLIVLIIFLYNNFTKNKDMEAAEASLDYLIAQISSESEQAEIYNPKGWIITSWPSELGAFGAYTETSLEYCTSRNWEGCLCICEQPGGSRVNDFISSCNKRAVCQESDFTIGYVDALSVKWNGYRIDNPPLILSLNQGSKEITLYGT